MKELLSRRDMMKITTAAAAALPLTGFAAVKRPGIALQLYSVRSHVKEGFDKVLEQVAQLGYSGVEFAGYHQYADSPEALRKKLDSLGLVAAGTHIKANSLSAGNLKKTIDFHATLGCKYLIVPGDGRFSNKNQSREYADLMNEAADRLKPHGMYCGHHNHTSEFDKTGNGDQTYWDLFAERTSKDVVLQQDVGWTTHAGLNPADLIRKYPGRTGITHFKPTVVGNEAGLQPIIGSDSVPWQETIQACCEVGGTEWFTVEQEKYIKGKSPMECSGLSLAGLLKILKDMGT